MNLVAVIERMEAQGMDPASILAAVKCMAAEQADAMERRRASDRERQARHRAKKASCHVTERDVTVTERDNPSPLVPPLEVSPAPLPKTPPIIPPSIQKPSRAKPAIDLPSDWQPDAKTWIVADELGFTSQQAWDQLERMRDWAKNAGGGKGRKSDWNAAFRNWLKRAADDKRNRAPPPRQRNSIQDSLAILDAVTDEAIRRAGGHGPQGGEEDPDLIPGLRQSAA